MSGEDGGEEVREGGGWGEAEGEDAQAPTPTQQVSSSPAASWPAMA